MESRKRVEGHELHLAWRTRGGQCMLLLRLYEGRGGGYHVRLTRTCIVCTAVCFYGMVARGMVCHRQGFWFLGIVMYDRSAVGPAMPVMV